MKKAQLGGLFRKGVKAVEKTAPKASKKLDTNILKEVIKKKEREALKEKMRGWDKEMGSKKNGGSMKKAKNGTSLGMKSVKAGFDNNPGVTRADIITAAKGKAQNGKKMTNSQIKTNVTLPKTKTKNINAFQGKKGMLAKSGTSMKKCKYGCK